MSFTPRNRTCTRVVAAQAAAPLSDLRWTLLVAGVCAASAAASWLGWSLAQGSQSLSAQTTGGLVDTDLDGLPDHQETVQSTDPVTADSDADGFSDLEELARQTDPSDPLSLPASSAADLGLTAYQAGGVLLVRTMIYVPGGDLSNIGLRFGFDYPARVKEDGLGNPIPPPELDLGALLAQSTVQSSVAADGSSLLLTVVTGFPASVVTEEAIFGPGLSIFAGLTAGPGQPIYTASAMSFATGSGSLHRLTATGSGSGGTTIEVGQRPVTIPDETPLSYTAEKVCLQQAVLGGTVGGTSGVYVVDSSNCVTSSSFCRSDCDALVDTEIEVFDPLALIGG